MVFICAPCLSGDHHSHDNRGRPWDGDWNKLDLFDCKNVNEFASEQCLCRENWPLEDSGHDDREGFFRDLEAVQMEVQVQ